MLSSDIVMLKELATALAKGAGVIADVFDDGKVDFKDLGKAPAVLSVLRQFAHVNYNVALIEAKDLSVEEAAELAAHFALEFKLPNGSIEDQVEAGLALITQVAVGIKQVYEAVKALLPNKAGAGT